VQQLIVCAKIHNSATGSVALSNCSDHKLAAKYLLYHYARKKDNPASTTANMLMVRVVIVAALCTWLYFYFLRLLNHINYINHIVHLTYITHIDYIFYMFRCLYNLYNWIIWESRKANRVQASNINNSNCKRNQQHRHHRLWMSQQVEPRASCPLPSSNVPSSCT
jgi:hypothetical protein